MLSLIEKDKRKNRFCHLELERMQSENSITMSEKFLTLKPATFITDAEKPLSKVLWIEHDNLGAFSIF